MLPLIFTPVQILWVNLVTDGLLDVTLAMEPKEEDVMDKLPRKPAEKIINREIMLSVIYVGIFMAIGTLWAFTKEWNSGNIIRAQTQGIYHYGNVSSIQLAELQIKNKVSFQTGFVYQQISTRRYRRVGFVAGFGNNSTFLSSCPTHSSTLDLRLVDHNPDFKLRLCRLRVKEIC